MDKAKRVSLTIEQKLSILAKLEEGTKPRVQCAEYGISPSTISKIKHNKDNLEEFASSSFEALNKRRHIKKPSNPDLEGSLYEWFIRQRELKNVVSDAALQNKARELFADSGQETTNFIASDGWLTKFKRRYGIRILSVSGESLSCDETQVAIFVQKLQEVLLANNYLPEQVYNCDETGLFYKGLPKTTNVHFKEKSAPGRKMQKQRVTIMPCVNATGNHKLPLMLIGKSERPRCFKNVNIPLHYKASKNAWQTRDLFSDWYINQFVPQVTEHLWSKNLPVKALLLVDNATCHGTELSVPQTENFKIMYFPPNMTPLLQPLDQHVIKSFKTTYRKLLLMLLASRNEDTFAALKSINLKDVSFTAVEAWNAIPKSVIINAFKHLFSCREELELNLPVQHFDETDDLSLASLFNSIFKSQLEESDIMEWASGKSDRCTTNQDCEDESHDNIEQQQEEEPSTHNINEVINALNIATEWSEEAKLPINEILLLRRIRNKAVVEKFKHS